MADDLPHPTPEKGGDDQPTANNANNEHGGQPKNKLNPTNSRIKERAGLTTLEWGGFFADLYVTLWVWSDLVGCRDIKRLIFLLATVFVAHGVLCYFVSKILNSWRWAISAWIVICIGASGVVWNNSRPASKPELALRLNTSDASDSNLLFTNDFLFWKEAPLKRISHLIIWVPPTHTNVVLRFGLVNNSRRTKADDDSDLTIELPLLELLFDRKNSFGANWVPSPQWTTNEVPNIQAETLDFRFPRSLLPDPVGESAPDIMFTVSDFTASVQTFAVIRAKNIIFKQAFTLCFIRQYPEKTNQSSRPYFETNDFAVVKFVGEANRAIMEAIGGEILRELAETNRVFSNPK
jgi:hypothetical protein